MNLQQLQFKSLIAIPKDLIFKMSRPATKADLLKQLALDPTLQSKDDCPICYGPLNLPTTTACGHAFCIVCLCKWLEHGDSCPSCRQKLYGKYTTAEICQSDAELNQCVRQAVADGMHISLAYTYAIFQRMAVAVGMDEGLQEAIAVLKVVLLDGRPEQMVLLAALQSVNARIVTALEHIAANGDPGQATQIREQVRWLLMATRDT